MRRRRARGLVEEGSADAAMEIEVERFEAAFVAGAGCEAPAAALHRQLRIDIEQDRQVRPEIAGGDLVERADPLVADAVSRALISERRADEAIAEHELAVAERRTEHLLHMLRARGIDQQQLGVGRPAMAAAQQQFAQRQPLLRAAGLARREERDTVLGERALDVRERAGLAAAVDTLENAEEAVLCRHRAVPPTPALPFKGGGRMLPARSTSLPP